MSVLYGMTVWVSRVPPPALHTPEALSQHPDHGRELVIGARNNAHR